MVVWVFALVALLAGGTATVKYQHGTSVGCEQFRKTMSKELAAYTIPFSIDKECHEEVDLEHSSESGPVW